MHNKQQIYLLVLVKAEAVEPQPQVPQKQLHQQPENMVSRSSSLSSLRNALTLSSATQDKINNRSSATKKQRNLRFL